MESSNLSGPYRNSKHYSFVVHCSNQIKLILIHMKLGQNIMRGSPVRNKCIRGLKHYQSSTLTGSTQRTFVASTLLIIYITESSGIRCQSIREAISSLL